jgi:hypothetical protein
LYVGAIALEGVAEFRCDMLPKDSLSAEYRNLVGNRTANANKRSGGLVVLEPSEIQKSVVMQAPTKVSILFFVCMLRLFFFPIQRVFFIFQHQRRKTEVNRRERLDKEHVYTLLFEAFKEKPIWELEELVKETEQPVQYLKTILEEVADFTKKGKSKGTYSLKQEYRDVAEQD